MVDVVYYNVNRSVFKRFDKRCTNCMDLWNFYINSSGFWCYHLFSCRIVLTRSSVVWFFWRFFVQSSEFLFQYLTLFALRFSLIESHFSVTSSFLSRHTMQLSSSQHCLYVVQVVLPVFEFSHYSYESKGANNRKSNSPYVHRVECNAKWNGFICYIYFRRGIKSKICISII